MPSYYEISYQLTKEEIVNGLLHSGRYKTTGKRAVVEMIILFVMFCVFLTSFIFRRGWFDLLMAILCAVVATAIIFMPRYDIKKHASQGEDKVKLRIYPDRIYVYTSKEAIPIELGANTEIKHLQKYSLITILPQDGGALVIPTRVFPEQDKLDIINRVVNLQLNKCDN